MNQNQNQNAWQPWVAMWHAQPKVTRTIHVMILLLTLGFMLKIVPGSQLIMSWQRVLKNGQLHLYLTSFGYAGQGFQLVFDLFMLYRFSTTLEMEYFNNHTAEYTWALLVISGFIHAFNYPLNTGVLFRPLMYAITSLWANASSPGQQMSLMGLISIPAQYYPAALLAMDFAIQGPEAAMIGLTGVLAAHAWLNVKQYVQPPMFVKCLLEPGVYKPETARTVGGSTSTGAGGAASTAREGTRRAYGTVFEPRREATTTAGVGVSSGGDTLRNRRGAGEDTNASETSGRTSGYQWGQGERLG